MKKTLILLLILTLVSAGGIGFAWATYGSQADEVSYRENTLSGDVSLVEGQQLQLRYNGGLKWNRGPQWNVDLKLGEEPQTSVQLTKYREAAKTSQEAKIEASFYLNQGYGSSDAEWVGNELNSAEVGVMREVFLDVASDTAPGEHRDKVVHLADYFDCYPINLTMSLPGKWRISTEDRLKLEQQIRFPITSDPRVGIGIEKNEKGEIVYFDSRWLGLREDYEEPNWSLLNLQTTDGYFIFASVMDGYDGPENGLYYLPFGAPTGDGGLRHAQVDQFRQVCSSKGAVSWAHLSQPDESGEFYFISGGRENVSLFRIREDGTVLQEWHLAKPDLQKGYFYEDFAVLKQGGGRLTVLAKDQTGDFAEVLQVAMAAEDPLQDIIRHGEVRPEDPDNPLNFHWDGERLMLLRFQEGEYRYQFFMEEEATYSDTITGFYLSAYDGRGGHYCGRYDCSLDVIDGFDHYDWIKPLGRGSNKAVGSPVEFLN